MADILNWRLISNHPVKKTLNKLLQNPDNLYIISLSEDSVVNEINKIWGLDIQSSDKKYDPNPGRHWDNKNKDPNTAKPSVCLNGEII